MDPELIAEARRRGLKIPGEYVQPQASQSVDPELIAEAKKRGLIPAQSEQSQKIEDIGVQSSGAMPIMNLLPENIRRAGVKGLMGTELPPTASVGEKIASGVGKYAPPIAASMLTVNPAAGLAVRSGMAAMGGGGAEAARQAIRMGAGEQDLSGAAREVGATAVGFGTGEAAMGIVAKGIQKAAPVIAQGVKALSGTPEKATIGALRNPEAFVNAQSADDLGEAYKAFEGYSGLKSIGSQELDREAQFSAGELFKMATSAMKRVLKGENVDAQTLYDASQAASRLKQMAKYGDASAAHAVGAGIVGQSKSVVDDALEGILPEYKSLRQGYAASKGAESLSSILPQNKNLSPNVLRTAGAATIAGSAILSGDPRGFAVLPLISPAFYGAGIKAAFRGAPAIKAAAQTASSELASYYSRVNKK